jgi:hypothetical protein
MKETPSVVLRRMDAPRPPRRGVDEFRAICVVIHSRKLRTRNFRVSKHAAIWSDQRYPSLQKFRNSGSEFREIGARGLYPNVVAGQCCRPVELALDFGLKRCPDLPAQEITQQERRDTQCDDIQGDKAGMKSERHKTSD